MFSHIRDDARAAGIEVVANVCDLELAKLLIARGQPERARPLLEKARQIADQTLEKEGVRRIDALLART